MLAHQRVGDLAHPVGIPDVENDVGAGKIAGDHSRAGFDERLGGGLADALGAARDEGDPVVEPELVEIHVRTSRVRRQRPA